MIKKVLRVRSSTPSEFEERLGAALEKELSEGVADLDVLCERLNSIGILNMENQPWTPMSLAQYLKQLP